MQGRNQNERREIGEVDEGETVHQKFEWAVAWKATRILHRRNRHKRGERGGDVQFREKV